jgi:ABC-type Fe3+ transport system permease subunit
MVAGLAAAASLLPALTAINGPEAPRAARLVGGAMVAAALIVAILPPEIIGISLVSVFSHPAISPPATWNIYDDSPVVWVAAMVARFGFLPICVAWLINRRVPVDLVAQARSDGANRSQCLVHARLALLWRPMLASGMMVGCLTLSEAAASLLVQPPRFFAGSLAVQVDMQMHYGRQSETTVLSLMLMIPAVLMAVTFPLMSRLRRDQNTATNAKVRWTCHESH